MELIILIFLGMLLPVIAIDWFLKRINGGESTSIWRLPSLYGQRNWERLNEMQPGESEKVIAEQRAARQAAENMPPKLEEEPYVDKVAELGHQLWLKYQAEERPNAAQTDAAGEEALREEALREEALRQAAEQHHDRR